MKQKIFSLFLCALSLLALTACGTSELEGRVAELEAQLTESNLALEQARTELSEARLALAQSEENFAELNTRLGTSSKENRELEKQVAALKEEMERLQMFPLAYLYLSEKDIDKCIILPNDDVHLYSAPSLDAPKEGLVGNSYAEVLVKVDSYDVATCQTTQWYLIRRWIYDNPQGEVGWVPAECVKEYTRENMYEITYPITLSDDTVFYRDRECKYIKETGASDFEISHYIVSVRMLENGICSISAKGGASAYTYMKYLIYPTP